MQTLRAPALVLVAATLALSGCGATSRPRVTAQATGKIAHALIPTTTTTVAGATSSSTAPGSPASGSPTPGATVATAVPGGNVYAATAGGDLAPAVRNVPARVYVPNSTGDSVDVIDPTSFQVIDHFNVGHTPHHIAPAWDLSKLYVDNTYSNSLTVIDPQSGKPVQDIPITDPYNLYFTPDGTKAVVVAERFSRLDFRDPHTWALLKSTPIPFRGVDHMDFTADGHYLLATTEFSGHVVRVDTQTMEVDAVLLLGGLPIDVKLSPDGSAFYVTNQGRHGVSVVDVATMKEVQFIPTGRGAHGLAISRDGKSLYVSNRLDGSMTVVDVATRQVTATWKTGGSPDMLQVSPDGHQVWVSNRFHGSVSVIDADTGAVIKTIKVGREPHGLAYFPQPGRYSLGHNGVYR